MSWEYRYGELPALPKEGPARKSKTEIGRRLLGRFGDARLDAITADQPIHIQTRRPTKPPSTARTLPVVLAALGDAKYAMALATSSAVTKRPMA